MRGGSFRFTCAGVLGERTVLGTPPSQCPTRQNSSLGRGRPMQLTQRCPPRTRWEPVPWDACAKTKSTYIHGSASPPGSHCRPITQRVGEVSSAFLIPGNRILTIPCAKAGGGSSSLNSKIKVSARFRELTLQEKFGLNSMEPKRAGKSARQAATSLTIHQT